ncbi:MAG: transglutaminase family protein [Polyangiales bacterium]
MSIRVALRHITRYVYDRPVHLGPQVVRLRPAPHSPTRPIAYNFVVRPEKHFLHWQQDPHGNHLARLTFPEKVTSLELDVELVCDLVSVNPFDFFLEPEVERMPMGYAPALATELAAFRGPIETGPLFEQLLATFHPRDLRTIDFLVDVNRTLANRVEYLVRMEPGVQTPEETLTKGSGSCRDSAWLLVALLRRLGFAARFVSGYLIQLRPDVRPKEGPQGPEADFTDLHAWCDVYLPGAGWIGLDPTSGLLAGEGHIPLCCTPEPASAAPLSGALDECEVTFEHHMHVERILETPRTTAPIDDPSFQRVLALGETIDADLASLGVKLTFGGEPTFVAKDHCDSPEWSVEALGPHKLERAMDLFVRMRERFAPHGVPFFGQGKWYPGEPLPRWALSCFFRRDGVPVWRDPTLVADGPASRGHGRAEAELFARTLAERLGVDGSFLLPGYEDTWYHLWRERKLPVNVTPTDPRLAWKEERERFARTFERGLGHVVGYCLPVRPVYTDEGVDWESGSLFLRQETLFLVPGDSPMGYRLPLDSLPWVADEDHPLLGEPDPFAPPPPIPPRASTPEARFASTIRRQAEGLREAGPQRPTATPGAGTSYGPFATGPAAHHPSSVPTSGPAPFESAWRYLRTALCVEARGGILHVFLPPLPNLPAFLSLVTAIEDVAARLSLPVRLEGYPPPYDPRLRSFSVTPDPGVIEVNVQPTSSWEELVDLTETLYALADDAKLRAEKYAMDGRVVGTGGGHHVTLGGPTAFESPLLRRPDLLRSLVGYFLDHPSLSYLFGGLFLGPTSQAPRIDEARHDVLHELEIAFAELDRAGPTPPPWLVDRVFRHLLTDVTGNTHRAEFCIDKLYSPDSSTGRLGLLEIRSFEMAPHPRMSLLQQLLVRALVAAFWEKPYEPRLVRWGSSLHDRFMLPFFVEKDFEGVLEELARSGYRFEREWFDAQFELRFPKMGSVAYEGVELTLRRALEPWHVLGEEGSSGGTSRYVDSSVERLEVRVMGAIEDRHVLLVNGQRVPLHKTGTEGEFVAGVRFRAWLPPSALHPTVGVHSPLVFDLCDAWLARSLGGCTYHVAQPNGRAFDTLPVNTEEAASRRKPRFVPFGHTPGPVDVPAVVRDPHYPLTLDLRRARVRSR